MDKLIFITMLFGLLLLQSIWFMVDPRSKIEVIKSNLGLKEGGSKVSKYFFYFLIISAILLYSYHIPIQFPSSSLDKIFVISGVIFYVSGFVFSVWARLTMKEKWIPAGEKHDLKRQNKIITSGPFKYSRNPIYLGLLLFYLGSCLTLRSYYIIFVIITYFYFYKVILKEEVFLEKNFGKDYLRYKQKTPRFI